mmetsp:Transcript_16951/g.52820  ORF Transcript_16951/g.52820 Transcript_16951/m.52820 type:complete len:108 (-) Transcript_16951:592-915(-)
MERISVEVAQEAEQVERVQRLLERFVRVRRTVVVEPKVFDIVVPEEEVEPMRKSNTVLPRLGPSRIDARPPAPRSRTITRFTLASTPRPYVNRLQSGAVSIHEPSTS